MQVCRELTIYMDPPLRSSSGCMFLFLKWMERKSDGGVMFRSDRAEEKEARRFSHHKQKVMEMLFAKIQAEFEKEEEGRRFKFHFLIAKLNILKRFNKFSPSGRAKPQRRRQTISRQDVANLQEGVELYEAVGDDPAYLEVMGTSKYTFQLHLCEFQTTCLFVF